MDSSVGSIFKSLIEINIGKPRHFYKVFNHTLFFRESLAPRTLVEFLFINFRKDSNHIIWINFLKGAARIHNFTLITMKIKVFQNFWIFQVNSPLLNFQFFFTIFPKLRGQKISKFCFMGQFLTLKNMVTKFFQNSNFSDFLGIKSEISQKAVPQGYEDRIRFKLPVCFAIFEI